jgi:hypothetical protein
LIEKPVKGVTIGKLAGRLPRLRPLRKMIARLAGEHARSELGLPAASKLAG